MLKYPIKTDSLYVISWYNTMKITEISLFYTELAYKYINLFNYLKFKILSQKISENCNEINLMVYI